MRSAWGPVAGGDEYYFGERRSHVMCANHDARTAAASAAVQAQPQPQAPASAAFCAQLSVGAAAAPNGHTGDHVPAYAGCSAGSTQNREVATAAANPARNAIPPGAPDKRQLQYLQQLSERNSALRRLRAVKSQQNVLKEKREQAFNMHWSGANDDRTRAAQAPIEHMAGSSVQPGSEQSRLSFWAARATYPRHASGLIACHAVRTG